MTSNNTTFYVFAENAGFSKYKNYYKLYCTKSVFFDVFFFQNHKHLRDDVIASILQLIKYDLSAFLLNIFLNNV